MFNVTVSGGCQIGDKRKYNQDNLYLNGQFRKNTRENNNLFLEINTNDEIQIYAVCEGMGEDKLGEIASSVAVQTLAKYHEEAFKLCSKSTIQKCIEEYIEDVNERLCDIRNNLNEKYIGTTIALVAIYGDYLYAYNLGNTKIYFISSNEIIQMSKDNIYIIPSKVLFRINKGVKFLICSDNLSTSISNTEIRKIIKNSKSDNDAVQKLVDKSLLEENIDNITAILINIESREYNRIEILLLSIFFIFIIVGINFLS